MILWWTVLFLPLISANFLVQLAYNSTADKFFHKHPSIYKDVSKIFSFGKFHAFCGNFDVKTIELIKALTAEVLQFNCLLDLDLTHCIDSFNDSRHTDSCKQSC